MSITWWIGKIIGWFSIIWGIMGIGNILMTDWTKPHMIVGTLIINVMLFLFPALVGYVFSKRL